MADSFVAESGLTTPALNAVALTPDDSNDLTTTTRGLYIGVGGNISVILEGDTVAVTFLGAIAGTVLPLRVKRLRSTSTTATNLVGLV
jgi:hypothetical protein